jgi:hypothetical protein
LGQQNVNENDQRTAPLDLGSDVLHRLPPSQRASS